MNLNRRQVLSLSLLLAGCGGGGGGSEPAPTIAASEPAPAARLSKDGTWIRGGLETALVVFNGEVLAIGFLRSIMGLFDGSAIRVMRYATGEVLAEHPWPGGMGSAIVKDGVIHVFGYGASGDKIIHSTLGAGFAPSAPVDALLMNAPASPFKFYNTSVTADANGFRMVVETTAGVYFARSADLDAWTLHGGQLMAGEYCGCPSIHFMGGVHWLTYLHHMGGGRYETRVARSVDDCFTFTYGRAVLTPEGSDALNCSDVDMVEIGGRVVGVYINGDQMTWGDLCKWSYDGTLAEMFAEYQ